MPLQLHYEHTWDLTPQKAIRLQQKLNQEVISQPLPEKIGRVGGVDVRYQNGQARDAFAGAASTGAPVDNASIIVLITYRNNPAWAGISPKVSFSLGSYHLSYITTHPE